ncbi:hypothetical protein H257_01246 [Aphanomyces astaci]|uniref:Uncharacterized protein n=1 Tax=Aphanomyces astaci TaxID=112090 RepID=W4H7D0_APHAT|nr:hypothetical protein H257_01246 [Aphanomyces astaci]ETV87792.1 hypothetical protein H257_01246 [Aphanomyces astaci]RQM22945.1 hypothetical protein B5M09_001833 [Aphanomyces astaci]|eukprot:XP_009822655.1 hypothetical protein H257_01246 [Aphanomyces astaci]
MVAAAKRVTWSTTTVHEFHLGHNACSVPSTGGPSVGLVGAAVTSRTAPVDDRLTAIPRSHRDQLLPPMRRIELLRDAGYAVDEIAVFCMATNQCRTERHETEQEYVALIRQRQYETYLVKQQIIAMEMERQRQLYLHRHYQMNMLPSHKVLRSRAASSDYVRQSSFPSYAAPPTRVVDVQVLDNKRRRLSVDALLN